MKFHLRLMHGKEIRVPVEDCKSLVPVKNPLRIKGIYSNKEYVFENENMRFSYKICYSECGRDDMDDQGEYLT